MGSATPLIIIGNKSMVAWKLMMLKELEDETEKALCES